MLIYKIVTPMKKIIYSLFYILIAYSTITCSEDFLDRKPLGRYTIDTYPAGGLTEYTYGMYSMLRQFEFYRCECIAAVAGLRGMPFIFKNVF